ncbi:hypothetical protein A946_11455 [Methylacidiphilum kamchatkense Kam1]|uniref:Uncharacterized protein n=1 Tax=Methylacidiphilum kamchatkense Kam1 TaxID=1202785 RepID=A0ABR4ZUJ6_9BACT|nr:hypothetical protein A946_11455 [Methylacidiphilum kamchatkense Kam1]
MVFCYFKIIQKFLHNGLWNNGVSIFLALICKLLLSFSLFADYRCNALKSAGLRKQRGRSLNECYWFYW